MDFGIITGMSGAGKARALHTLEDIGVYCVDNMPPQLISRIADLGAAAGGGRARGGGAEKGPCFLLPR